MLLKQGHDPRVIVGGNRIPSETVQSIPRSTLWRALDWGARQVGDLLALSDLYRPSFWMWRRAIEAYHPDIVHVHWTYGAGGAACIPLMALPWLSGRYPLVWTFHDMWGMTGACGHVPNCERWRTGCGSCPQRRAPSGSATMNYTRGRWDTSAFLWRIKRGVYRRSHFSVICPSQWLTNLARQSPLLEGKPIHCIPNGLDTTLFRPLPKTSCREALGIPVEKRVLLFIGKPGDVFAYVDRVPVFVKALQLLSDRYPDLAEQIVLLIIGEQGESLAKLAGYPAVCLGAVSRPQIMALAYSAADALVYTSQADNLPGVIQESLACGTPSVASRVGGAPEMVRHLETGYLAKRDAPEDFAEGIRLMLSDDRLRARLSENARRFAVEEYMDDVIVQRVLEVYQEQIALCE